MYDEVEKKLTLLTNKATMSYEASAARIFCDKFRIFISGLKRSLSDVLFSAKPKDMPTALALAQEVASNHERYTFATSFAKSLEDRVRKQFPKAQERQQTPYQAHSQVSGGKNPHFTKQVKAQVHSAPHNDKRRENTPEPELEFSETQQQAFQKLRNILASEDVMLRYPDYKKAFDLTTDASAHGIGAVLSQEGRPITMISRTLKAREVNYATNERELLAIVWALAKLRHYLYAVKDINIITDHQPLTFAVSESNPNAKI
ncbi:hypothetical protein KR054_004873 [Drosophila jambulina]|nr:hypothetical protein KR054_004873 [Drosophila jambulina]